MARKIVDGFIWLLVTDKAIQVFTSGLFELYVLYNDGSETLVESNQQIRDAVSNGLDIGIEVGFVDDEDSFKQQAIEFSDKGELHRILLTITKPDMWFNVHGYDLHYSEEYNEINIYRQGETISIYSIKIT